jgi:hypothetical protein
LQQLLLPLWQEVEANGPTLYENRHTFSISKGLQFIS